MLVCCCLRHHPVNCKVEEQRRHTATLPYASLHIEGGVAVFYSSFKVVVETLDEQDDLMWNSICPEYTPKTFTVDAVESFLEIYTVDVKLPLQFCTLLDHVSQSEDRRVTIWSVLPLPFRKPAYSCLSRGLARNRKPLENSAKFSNKSKWRKLSCKV